MFAYFFDCKWGNTVYICFWLNNSISQKPQVRSYAQPISKSSGLLFFFFVNSFITEAVHSTQATPPLIHSTCWRCLNVSPSAFPQWILGEILQVPQVCAQQPSTNISGLIQATLGNGLFCICLPLLVSAGPQVLQSVTEGSSQLHPSHLFCV